MRWIYKPIPKAILNIISVFLSGILCSALVTEITGKDGTVKWNEMTSNKIFYAILCASFLAILYNIFSARVEINFRQKFNIKFLKKFIEEQGLDTLASEVNKAIKNNNSSKLSNLLDMKELIIKNLEEK